MTQLQPIKWHGGKSYLAPTIHSLAPPSANVDLKHGYTHRNIVFAGGLGELWNWEHEGVSETVNDINGDLTNFWRVLRHWTHFVQFQQMCEATEFGSKAFQEAIERLGEQRLAGVAPGKPEDDIARAWAFFAKYRLSRQGLGKDFATPTKRTRRGMNENVSAWLTAVDGLPAFHARLRRVEVRNLLFGRFLKQYDHERAFFYLDPPYLHETRSTGGGDYQYEMTEGHHSELLRLLGGLKGKFMLSGYPSAFYAQAQAEHGWRHVEIEIDNKASSRADKPKQIECLWMNY